MEGKALTRFRIGDAAYAIHCVTVRLLIVGYIDNLKCCKACGVSGFRTKLFENLQSYPYTVSDKNVAQGT